MLDRVQIRRALEAFMGLAEAGNLFLDDTAPWKLRKTDLEACGSALHVALQFLPPLSVMAAPFIPGVAARLREMLNLPEREAGPLLPAETLRAGHKLGTPEVLCEKIDDEVIEAELSALKR